MSQEQTNNTSRLSHASRLRHVVVIVAAAASFFMTGCNSLKDVRAARGSGTKYVFDASFDNVWAAVPKAANELDLGVAGSYRDDRYYLVQRGWTAFSWGEKVAIFVEPLGTTRTEVEIVSKRVLATNVTAPNWERRLFREIAKILGLPRP